MGRGNGGGGRRASRTSRDARRAGAEIVVLTWAQTFGRGARAPKRDAARVDGERDPSDDGSARIVVLGEGEPGF
ncbi:hypothetical protein [Methylobacterium aquaticum]|uniref:hypothetical protein n=1 Tax=Methylobacterium aquaticum TaxID=270351 RepID=UPI0019313167|nr:hypothetical protein [Methylobacterium aquaticum]QRE72996.1 hypothetical protein F1D61_04355 [Methylobacterium aquaticum]